mmetsp:Transcript_4186/g.3930  ORF Transcript_4186/g.3930 Transcript_4186/m.3930 type:complete len:238 (-) Transcript_4186:871-1584(-)
MIARREKTICIPLLVRNRINSSASNIKFGKLTIQRGPSKESLDSAVITKSSGKRSVKNKHLNFTNTPDQATNSSKGKNSKTLSKFMTPRIKNSGEIHSRHRFTASSRMGSKKDLLTRPLFNKTSKGTQKRTHTKSPFQETVCTKPRKKGRLGSKSKRSITPVIQKKQVLASNKFTKTINPKESVPFLFSNQDNNTGLSIQKCNESDELESIEQDIANLEKLKSIGKIGEQFVFELDE